MGGKQDVDDAALRRTKAGLPRFDVQIGPEPAHIQIDSMRREVTKGADGQAVIGKDGQPDAREFIDVSYSSGGMSGRASYEVKMVGGRAEIDKSSGLYHGHPDSKLPADHPERQFVDTHAATITRAYVLPPAKLPPKLPPGAIKTDRGYAT